MNLLNDIKIVIFDMDGLMIDSSPTWEKAETLFVNKYGKQYSHEIRKKYLGMKVKDILKVMIDEYPLPIGIEVAERELKSNMKESFSKSPLSLMPGCVQLIKNLTTNRKYKLAVASSSPKEFIELVLRRLNLKTNFSAVVSGEEVNRGKPAPDIFLKAGRLLNDKPMHCLVLEDAPHGVRAGKDAGMRVFGVNSNDRVLKELKAVGADMVFRSLAEIQV